MVRNYREETRKFQAVGSNLIRILSSPGRRSSSASDQSGKSSKITDSGNVSTARHESTRVAADFQVSDHGSSPRSSRITTAAAKIFGEEEEVTKIPTKICGMEDEMTKISLSATNLSFGGDDGIGKISALDAKIDEEVAKIALLKGGNNPDEDGWDQKVAAWILQEERRQKPPKVKNKVSKPAQKPDNEEVFRFPDSLDMQWETLEEEKQEEEEDELAQLWRDADLAFLRARTDRNLKRNAEQQDVEEECEHDFSFKEDIGKVCMLCGWVAQLVTGIFELRRPTRPSTKKKRASDDDDYLSIPQLEDQIDVEIEALVPHERHAELLHEHQKEGFRFMSEHLLGKNPQGVFLNHAPGTGKTFLVISFLNSCFATFPTIRALITAPKNMLQQWEREFRNWEIDPINIYILNAGQASKLNTLSKWTNEAGVLLITPQLLSKLIGESKLNGDLQGDEPNDCYFVREMLQSADILVVDEAHYARTEKTRIWDSLKKIKTQRRIFLSGTVFQNNTDELFNLFKLCRPNFLSNFPEFVRFVENYQGYKTREALEKYFFREEVEKKVLEEMNVQVEDVPSDLAAIKMFRRLTSSFLHWYGGKVLENLPGLDEYILEVTLSDSHIGMVKARKFTKHMEMDGWLARACVHPCLVVSEEPVYTAQDPWEGIKTAFIMELIMAVGQTKERVIIFGQFRYPLNLLQQMLKERFGWSDNNELFRMDGDTEMERRQWIIDQFNAPKSKAKVLLASTRACGEGISLVGASRVVILDEAWNPATVRQAVSRAYRIGQKKKVHVYRLLASDTNEVRKHFSLLKKNLLATALLDNGFNTDDLHSLKSEELCPVVREIKDDEFLREFVERHRNRCEVYRDSLHVINKQCG